MSTFSKSLEKTLHDSVVMATNMHHEYITLEHLLYALTDNKSASSVIVRCGANIEEMRIFLNEHLQNSTDNSNENTTKVPEPTAATQRVIQRAVVTVKNYGREQINGSDVLIALFGEQDSYAVSILIKCGIDRDKALKSVTNTDKEMEYVGEEEVALQDEETALEKYCVDLNQKATDGKIDPLIGREEEVERTIQVLCRRKKNNPLFVGDPGVGKTAIAEGIAQLIVEKKVPEVISDCVIFSLDLGAMMAGTRFRGDFEERIKAVIKEIKEHDNAIMFIDEIHMLIGAGATGGGAMDASNLLKPALAAGELRCIGSTTYAEYRQHFEKDKALVRRFQKIDVKEPSVADAIKILTGLQSRYEDFHKIKYAEDAIKSAVELSSRYIHDRKLPDKAIDVIDESGAAQMLFTEDKRKKRIEVADIENIIAKIARIPSKNISQDDRSLLKDLASEMKNSVFGQNSAIDALVSSIKTARAGLREMEKPVGCYLFSGPTGVGKTEVAKQLSNSLNVPLIRFDMSEYMEPHSVSRLIGAPPGYVGFDQGGLLTDSVDQNPHCVLLLDEIEKAHPQLFNILLQVMDNGQLTDNNGKTVSFRNVILIMTTNAGAQNLAASAFGFTQNKREGDDLEAINSLFAPEFRNRLDSIVSFSHLTTEIVRTIVDKFVHQLEEQLSEREIQIDLSDDARDWLAVKGYDESMGARPLARVIQKYIKQPLAEEVLFGKLMNGGRVTVVIKGDELGFEFTSKKRTVPKIKNSSLETT